MVNRATTGNPVWETRGMRRKRIWLITAPLAFAGGQLGHLAVNGLLGAPLAKGEVFVGGGPGSDLLPALSILGAALLLSGLIVQILAPTSMTRGATRAVPYALFVPLVFVVTEFLEFFLAGGTDPVDVLQQRTFWPGLALQLPFALAAYLAARVVLGVATETRRWLLEQTCPYGHGREARAARPLPRPRPRQHHRSGPAAVRGPPATTHARPALT